MNIKYITVRITPRDKQDFIKEFSVEVVADGKRYAHSILSEEDYFESNFDRMIEISKEEIKRFIKGELSK